MFSCERCGSRYSAMHAAALENCPRCQIRDRISTPLVFKAFEFPKIADSKPSGLPPGAASAQARGDSPESGAAAQLAAGS